jgi:hypothetical protein
MSLEGRRIYDEDGNPISSTEHNGDKRAIDVTNYESSTKGGHALKVEELLCNVFTQLKILNRHMELLNDMEITDKDI